VERVLGQELAADGFFLIGDGFAVGDDDGEVLEGVWAGEAGEGGEFLLEEGGGEVAEEGSYRLFVGERDLDEDGF